MLRRAFLLVAPFALPAAAAAQPATPPLARGHGPPRTEAERAERHRWHEEHWGALTPEQRQQAEDRFRRGAGPHGPDADEMRRRWEGMTPGQRRELMLGHHGEGGRHGPGRGARHPGMGPGGHHRFQPSGLAPDDGVREGPRRLRA